MNRTLMNKEANRLLKLKFIRARITHCEVCGTDNFLTFAHRLKRRHMNTIEELADIDNVLLLCVHCHQRQEFSKEITEEWFSRLRPLVLK